MNHTGRSASAYMVRRENGRADMTNDEAKQAFFRDEDVIYHGDEYEITGKIQSIVYTKDTHGRLVVSAEIPGNNSLTRVRIKDLEVANET